VLLFFLYLGPNPHFGMTLETTLSPLSFGKSFMKIRSAVPENGCLMWRTEKKNRKTSVKHIRIRLIGGCVNYRQVASERLVNVQEIARECF